MQHDEFLKRVMDRAHFAGRDEAERYARAVLVTVKSRTTTDAGRDLASQLPHELRETWEGGFIQRIADHFSGTERLDLGGFLAKVADEAGIEDMTQAETVTGAVLATISEAVSPGAVDSVLGQLPEDIRGFWRSSARPEQETRPAMEAAAEVQTLPFEMEAPVVPTCIECETGAAMGDWRTPAEDRVETMAPPEARMSEVEGPGSETFYRADAELHEEIRHLLDSAEGVDAEKVDVFVQAGNVTLRGSVDSDRERDAAVKAATKALGVGDVRNELKVEQ